MPTAARALSVAALLLFALLFPRSAEACGGGRHAKPKVKLPAAQQTRLSQARTHERFGECDQAMAIIDELFEESEIARHHPWVLRVAGSCELVRGQHKLAKKHLTHVEDSFSGDAEFEARLAEAEVQTGEVKRGAARLAFHFKRGALPDVRAYLTLTRARLLLKDKAGAKAAVDHALLRFPYDEALKKLKAELG